MSCMLWVFHLCFLTSDLCILAPEPDFRITIMRNGRLPVTNNRELHSTRGAVELSHT